MAKWEWFFEETDTSEILFYNINRTKNLNMSDAKAKETIRVELMAWNQITWRVKKIIIFARRVQNWLITNGHLMIGYTKTGMTIDDLRFLRNKFPFLTHSRHDAVILKHTI